MQSCFKLLQLSIPEQVNNSPGNNTYTAGPYNNEQLCVTTSEEASENVLLMGGNMYQLYRVEHIKQ